MSGGVVGAWYAVDTGRNDLIVSDNDRAERSAGVAFHALS